MHDGNPRCPGHQCFALCHVYNGIVIDIMAFAVRTPHRARLVKNGAIPQMAKRQHAQDRKKTSRNQTYAAYAHISGRNAKISRRKRQTQQQANARCAQFGRSENADRAAVHRMIFDIRHPLGIQCKRSARIVFALHALFLRFLRAVTAPFYRKFRSPKRQKNEQTDKTGRRTEQIFQSILHIITLNFAPAARRKKTKSCAIPAPRRRICPIYLPNLRRRKPNMRYCGVTVSL